jgi:hypothetical protein
MSYQDELRALVDALRRDVRESEVRQRKLLALAAKWEAMADDGDGEWYRLDLFGRRKAER